MRDQAAAVLPVPNPAWTIARRAARWLPWIAGLLLAGAYVSRYATDPNRPGNDPVYPLGWLGWFDQSVTLRSVAALAHGNLDQSQHHYPLGYALLGIPGYWVAPEHAFFIVGLVSLLGALAAFVAVGRRLDVPAPVSAVLFCAATLSDPLVFRNWSLPWNTTPVAALLWGLLAAMAGWIGGRRRPVWSGIMIGLIAVCRPTEAVIGAIPLAAACWSDVRAGRSRAFPLADWLRLGLAAAAVIVPVIGLHLAIYGPHPSLYMISSRQIGFTLQDIGWKAYVLLVDPYAWFKDGHGLLQHRPWLALGLAGLLLSFAAGLTRAMVAATIAAHGLLYIAYVDLLPTGLFRFLNVHYVMWSIPGLALLAALLLRDLCRRGRPRLLAAGAVVVTALALGVRLEPKEAPEARVVKAVDFDGPMPPFTGAYFEASTLVDDVGPMTNAVAMRVFIVPSGIRVIGMQRDIVGAVHWRAGAAPPGFEAAAAARRLVIAVRWSWPPAWLWKAKGPRIPVPEH